MKKAVLFNEFALHCPYRSQNTKTNGSYGCKNPNAMRENKQELDDCSCNMCLFGIAAEQEDIDNPKYSQNIEWNSLCADGKASREILLIDVSENVLDVSMHKNNTDCQQQKKSNIIKKLLQRLINNIKRIYKK